jgi:hypothetical protein
MNAKQIIIWSLIITVLIEGVTILFRFGFNLQSTRDTASTIGLLTGGIRIHHGYIGILMVIISIVFLKKLILFYDWFLIIGISLICSDIIHHFIVLWIITGNHEFHLFYPNSNKNP